MLKALELIGFKSFADKTRFEFNPGITVVVGPNGSGKSNVVDAIKWVLGEQSVKSLRGTEMADVIFNGSASRRPLNSAETTLVFDNSDKRLPMDTPEVHITRRVYRSGEGEYLINRQPCRLRDIRDLFAGTGAATEAYSVIEQGKVDVLLQSSPRDRRLIFEEAAGISRFKAKKIEALRRLDRVEQNLLRLSDIVDEVEGRLRTVRQQASKARRFQELSGRLQQFRLGIGSADWRKLTDRLTMVESELTLLRDQSGAATAQTEAIEAAALTLESGISDIDQQIRAAESQIAENRQLLAGLEGTIEHERVFSRDLEEQAGRHRRQLATHNFRAVDVEGQFQSVAQTAADAEEGRRLAMTHLADHERALTALTAQLDQIRDENHQRRSSLLEETKAASALANDIGGLESQIAALQETRETSRAQSIELTQQRESLATELAQLEIDHSELTSDLAQRAAALTAAQSRLTDGRRRQTQRQKELATWRERRTAAAERSRLLTELEHRLEGVSAGVKEVLALAKAEAPGPFAAVRGILADLLQADEQMAPLVELALGERAQYVVLTPGQKAAEFVQFLLAQAHKLSGRVGFFAAEVAPPLESTAADNWTQKDGVLGRADRFLQTASEYAPLVRRLLGRVWIVKTLADALRLSTVAPPGAQFITLGGEVLHPDGSLSVGPPQSATGIISRRSELRSLAKQIADRERQIDELEENLAGLERDLAEQDRDLLDLTTQHQQAAEQLAEGRLRLGGARQRQVQCDQQLVAVEGARKAAEEQFEMTSAALAVARTNIENHQAALEHAEIRINENARRIGLLEESRDHRNRETMMAKVELARREQQLDHLRTQLRQFEQDRQERQRAILDGSAQLGQATQRIRESEDRILTAECQLAELYLRKESLAAATVRLINTREDYRREKNAAVEQSQQYRAQIRKLDEQWRQREMSAGQLKLERTALADRLREDYGIELGELTKATDFSAAREATIAGEVAESAGVVGASPECAPVECPPDRAAAEEEIAELRRKLSNIGNVNLDSLHEADELETRFQSLSNQFQDLSKAKTALQQIVGKINADSRRLFAETLETVRGHFQELFRKLFGGGQADIILDQGIDILDTGIEIVARPPGKEPRNISLLSGGEKTLTCVALLLAIFRSRPSPFCVLDEVDAALDEANTERFVGVLTEFLAWTRFIVVTHSKKTMTAANTLYGVTMQESGVSKRVSVRFEDVSENGEIRERSAANSQPSGENALDDDIPRRAA